MRRNKRRLDCYISTLICPSSGHKYFVPREPRKSREKGHKKKIFCVYCGRYCNMTEIRYGDFYIDGKVV